MHIESNKEIEPFSFKMVYGTSGEPMDLDFLESYIHNDTYSSITLPIGEGILSQSYYEPIMSYRRLTQEAFEEYIGKLTRNI